MNSPPRPSAPFTYVDTDAELARVVDHAHRAQRLAIDTEADSLHHYHQKVCLIQLSINSDNYIIDPLADVAMDDFLSLICEKPLILHGADYDLRIMRDTFRIKPRGDIFDTMIAAQLLGYEELGLGAVANRHFGVKLSSRSQKSNWARRPLTKKQLAYACDDTRFLEPLADKLAAELAALGRTGWHQEACATMVEATSQDNPKPEEDRWRIKGLRDLDRKQLAYVREIWEWRDNEASDADRPPFKILGNPTIIELAVWASNHPDASLTEGPSLPKNCTGQRLRKLKDAIARASKASPEAYPDHRRSRGSRPDCQESIDALRNAAAKIADDLDLPAPVLAPKAALIAIARKKPKTLEEIMAAGPLMRWQADLLAPAIQEVVGNG